jgi:hypothetical protein
VASADTWEHFKITIPGDTGGTINNDTGAGLSINFPLVCGSTYQNTKDTWAAGEDYGSGSVQNLLDNTANNIYITGVQLEVGSVATDFAHEDIGTTLQKCLRYFWDPLQGGGDTAAFNGMQLSTTRVQAVIQYPVRMRAAPTFAVIDTGTTGDGIQVQDHSTAAWMTSTSWSYANQRMGWLAVDWSGGIGAAQYTMRIYSANANTRMQWSAEI